jgi:prepilin-type processing-associated H-X9-DG protein
MTCANNLKQLGLAMHNYHDANNGFPPGRAEGATFFHAWTPYLLPYIELDNLYKQYNFATRFDDPATNDTMNPPGPTRTFIKLFVCPSAPNRSAGVTPTNTRMPLDYAHIILRTPSAAINPPVDNDPTGFLGVLGNNLSRKQTDVRDGTSNTFLLVEVAGRNQEWKMGRATGLNGGNGNWSNPGGACINVAGFDPGSGTRQGTCGVNCTNISEIYSFHTSGANVLLADGSVHFLRAFVDINLVLRLVTRDRGEIIPPDLF